MSAETPSPLPSHPPPTTIPHPTTSAQAAPEARAPSLSRLQLQLQPEAHPLPQHPPLPHLLRPQLQPHPQPHPPSQPPPQQQQPLLQLLPEEQPREKDMNRADKLRAALPEPMTRSRRRRSKLWTQTRALSRKNWCVRALSRYGRREGWSLWLPISGLTWLTSPHLRSLIVLAHTQDCDLAPQVVELFPLFHHSAPLHVVHHPDYRE